MSIFRRRWLHARGLVRCNNCKRELPGCNVYGLCRKCQYAAFYLIEQKERGEKDKGKGGV